MPIDYVKTLLNKNKIKSLENHPLLEFFGKLNERTGELSSTRVAKYRGLVFTIRLNRVWLSGSLHYFYNDGNHNYSDFEFYQLLEALDEISKTFDLDLSECRLENLEIGVNIELWFKTTTLLNNILFHKVERFDNERVRKGKGYYKVATHDRYEIKCYDKACQFSLPYNLWRFEVHFRKMADLKKIDVIYLSDLKDTMKIKALGEILVQRFEEVFIYDWTINETKLKKSPKDFSKMRLPYYWIDELNKNNRLKRRQVYVELVKVASSQIKLKLLDLIEMKLFSIIEKKRDCFTIEIENV